MRTSRNAGEPEKRVRDSVDNPAREFPAEFKTEKDF
jgi:hypothetical protein